MAKKAAASTNGTESFWKEAINLLDAIYTWYDCEEHVTELSRIEKNLYLGRYAGLHSFRHDLRQIPMLTPAFLEKKHRSRHPEQTNLELPIFKSLTLRKESCLYAITIKQHSNLHVPLLEEFHQSAQPSQLPLFRLFIAKRHELLLEARDAPDAILAVFLQTDYRQVEDSHDLSRVTAKLALVHPVGNFHEMNKKKETGLEGWMKVKLIDFKAIDTVISTQLARQLFENDSETVQSLPITKNDTNDEVSARENEIRQQFLYTITSQHYRNRDFEFLFDQKPPYLYRHEDERPSNHPAAVMFEADDGADFLDKDADHWTKLEQYCLKRGATVQKKQYYSQVMKRARDAEGYYKSVYFMKEAVVQLFCKPTPTQRIIETVSLLRLRGKPYIGQMNGLIQADNSKEAVGLVMKRYSMTLREYLADYIHRRLSNYQCMDIILQLLRAIQIVHMEGIAHRDLSTVNFMMDVPDPNQTLPDGTPKTKIYLIDFGKAVFIRPKDAQLWWIPHGDAIDKHGRTVYKDEVRPRNKDELTVWCRNLPLMMAKPDQGYRLYRSIQTLPRNQRDRKLLPYLIDPIAEDIYSMGTLIWKIFSGMEPWPGVFDTDLGTLREKVGSDEAIDKIIHRETPGPVSAQFLKFFLRVRPENRWSITEILGWLERPAIHDALLQEWDIQPNAGSRTRPKAYTSTGADLYSPDEASDDGCLKSKKRRKHSIEKGSYFREHYTNSQCKMLETCGQCISPQMTFQFNADMNNVDNLMNPRGSVAPDSIIFQPQSPAVYWVSKTSTTATDRHEGNITVQYAPTEVFYYNVHHQYQYMPAAYAGHYQTVHKQHGQSFFDKTVQYPGKQPRNRRNKESNHQEALVVSDIKEIIYISD